MAAVVVIRKVREVRELEGELGTVMQLVGGNGEKYIASKKCAVLLRRERRC